MRLDTALRRGVPGAFVLNSGIGKLGLDEESAAGLQQMAANGVPFVEEMTPAQFGKFLSYCEIAVGAALLLPLIPIRIAGAALDDVLRRVGRELLLHRLHGPRTDGIRPSEFGTAVAKDTWLAAIGLALMFTTGDKKKKNKKNKK